jgi:hypothetical protein
MAKAIRRPTLAFILIAEARGFLARKDIIKKFFVLQILFVTTIKTFTYLNLGVQ